MEARAQEVAEALSGTSDILDYHATPEEIASKTFMDALALLVFECDGCGWWCDEDEMNTVDGHEGPVCNDCLSNS